MSPCHLIFKPAHLRKRAINWFTLEGIRCREFNKWHVNFKIIIIHKQLLLTSAYMTDPKALACMSPISARQNSLESTSSFQTILLNQAQLS